MSSLIAFRISEKSLSLKVTRTFSLPHSHMNISSFTFIRQAWNSVVCDLVVKVGTNSREDCKNCKNRPPRPPPKLKTQPYFHAFVIVPYTLFRNNSKKLRLLKGYHMNIILPRACKKFIVTKICPLIGSDKSAWRSGVGDLTSRTLTDAQCISLDVHATWKQGLPFFVKGFPTYWDHSILNPFVRKSTCFVYLQSSFCCPVCTVF